MVTMTSEVDKTQTSIVLAAKSAAESAAASASSPIGGEEMGHRQRIALEGGDNGEVAVQTLTASKVTSGDDCNEVPEKIAITTTTTTNMKPLELSSVTISIELASEDDSSTAATPATAAEAAICTTITPAIPVMPTTPQGATPKTVATPDVAPPPATPTNTVNISATTPTATAVEAPAAITATTTKREKTTASVEAAAATKCNVKTTVADTTSFTLTENIVGKSENRNNDQNTTTSTTTTFTAASVKTIATVASGKTIVSTSTTTTSSPIPSTSTPKVNFNMNSANSTTSNSTCTSSTNSTSSVTSMSTPAAVGGITGNGNGNTAASTGLGVSNSHYHHQHHQQQQQQSAQHGKSSASSGSGGGADGSHTALPGAKSSLTTGAILNHPQQRRNEDAPNILVYKKYGFLANPQMEAIIEKMQAESTGVAVRTVKAFMSKVPSVFTGADLVAWILKNLDVEDVTEALHFAHLLASHGYIFPIDDHQLTVKNDGTFYRFQTPYFWPSNCWEPENTDYAVYLCKRTMQNKTRLELADYEAENLAKLQKMFSRKWEFIFMQAESQSKVAKKRDKLERKVLDSQERAFWDVHRPMPGCVNTTEIDIKKAYRRGGHGCGTSGGAVAKNPVEQVTRVIGLRKQKLERRTIKVSKAAEALVAYYEQYNEFDYFITSPELPNPWQTDSTEMWDAERNSKEVPLRHVKRWGFSLRELLNDPVGREQFTKFLEKEYSGENLKFWESVQQMKTLPQSEIKEAIHKIWQEFLAPDAPCPVNVDSKSVELAREAVNATNGPNRWCFDVAAAHVYHLMKSDSYSRYLRSDMYKDYLNCSRKKIKSIPNLFGVKR
ncbi:PREDICTED: regulator of G-protein signaling 7 isoform X1 [Bactrocera latifrons]|uniref:regulator of G-protein signaling 7 isoform X1 n=1 Tax=Bactrocera latifrons TaxID=174628 RepID=UPI0008DD4CED|nr:PREDICTED: regulator of G-protein signaling 7 isoform X1 [Bactrocera latifrons]